MRQYLAVTLLMGAATFGGAQDGPKHFFSKKQLNLGTDLRINVHGVSPSSSWILGIVGRQGAPVMAAGSGFLSAPVQAGRRQLSDVKDHPASMSYGSVDLDLQGKDSLGLVVFMEVPKDTRIQCYVEGKLLIDKTMSSSIILKDGVQPDGDLERIGQLVLRLEQQGAPSPPPRLARLPSGKNVVSNAMMRERLSGNPTLTNMPAPACHCARRAAVVLNIGSNGHVTAATMKFGDQEVGAAAIKDIQKWIFKPFVDGGVPIDVEGLLIVQNDRNGNMTVAW